VRIIPSGMILKEETMGTEYLGMIEVGALLGAIC
jgi:hypothetical protein